jgi:hypothetical protein
VAARPLSCAGDHVSVVSFAATSAPLISPTLLEAFAIPQQAHNQHIVLPAKIDNKLEGAKRNATIRESLIESASAKSLIMAQPFTGEDMVDFYQIPAKLIRWLNDKSTMTQYIDARFLPTRLGIYENGTAFAKECKGLTLPFVVKAASSSAGDGVFICQTAQDLRQAVKQLRTLRTTILIEAYVEVRHNFGIHFGIPHKPSQPIDILGINEQLTTPEGEFIGGLISSTAHPQILSEVITYLVDEVLPQIRDMGWYGVGCFDVLADDQGRLYFIDSNFRMTGMSAYHFLVANRTLEAPLLGFSGSFAGSPKALLVHLTPYAWPAGPQKIMQLIALNRQGKVWNFNGALLFENQVQLRERAKQLLRAGIKSEALEQILRRHS